DDDRPRVLHLKVVPLAADSLGVRSMATYVEAGSTGLLLDPGATLAPSRYGLPPSAEEWEALKRANDRISAYAARARYVFVSHYHEDHFRSDPATYAGRVVLVKDPRRMVSGAQSRRAEALWKALDGPARVQAADSVNIVTQHFELHVSPAPPAAPRACRSCGRPAAWSPPPPTSGARRSRSRPAAIGCGPPCASRRPA